MAIAAKTSTGRGAARTHCRKCGRPFGPGLRKVLARAICTECRQEEHGRMYRAWVAPRVPRIEQDRTAEIAAMRAEKDESLARAGRLLQTCEFCEHYEYAQGVHHTLRVCRRRAADLDCQWSPAYRTRDDDEKD